MKLKNAFFMVCLFLIGNMAFAQGVLEVTDISKPYDVYSSADDEAAVVIRCHESIPLKFSSTMDKDATPFKVTTEGANSVYYIAFPTGKRYRGRELSIYAKGFTTVTISLELQPKQLLTFQITDPNATVDAGCYREHRNKGVEEIKNMNYEEARNQFVLASECSEADKEESEKNLALADSLIFFRSEADKAYQLLDYVTAENFYSKILSINAYDTYASNRYTICAQNFSDECASLFSKAEFYYAEKEFDKAVELYEKMVARECRNTPLAVQRLNSINSNQRAKKNHARVLTYEYRKDVPFGFSYGKYNMHKTGGFFQMDLNNMTFDAIRSECKYGDKKFPELNMSFGWTIKIVNPVWIHFGPGFTTKMYYGTYLSKKYPKIGYGEKELLNKDKMGSDLTLPKDDVPSNYEDGWKKANLAFAISPVIGLTIKYNYFAIRATYQYRWPVQKDLEEFIESNRISVGVGVAF